jgi:hypothetical protein
VPGIVWLVRAGSTTITLTAGVADVGKGRPVAADDEAFIAAALGDVTRRWGP